MKSSLPGEDQLAPEGGENVLIQQGGAVAIGRNVEKNYGWDGLRSWPSGCTPARSVHKRGPASNEPATTRAQFLAGNSTCGRLEGHARRHQRRRRADRFFTARSGSLPCVHCTVLVLVFLVVDHEKGETLSRELAS